jgi:hypothetical protein
MATPVNESTATTRSRSGQAAVIAIMTVTNKTEMPIRRLQLRDSIFQIYTNVLLR